ncbi:MULTISPECIES: GlxA family transcriptional regulator [Phyllobacteriaceae]|jgi:transcriptional regulator GlxA family with amidase domain|uniref:AraC family transcriptional regulator n=1 Tax=Mesorhizobium hungaricum TaxID=1566387 RepID=A0A1C2DYU8_9HYPH|nr:MULTISPECIES: helix-turn-helix domain-containing protein [Mesorhizobium]MBN9234621.1 helix-turn-helix domain-containing protein [Mesorhizobium sp.]MDQ0328899.1 transcriptional regulator GlxA family with amidase domain [Mesorhizobium sp. YL-MeA3-2017]OCX19940.1 AraC family transcriptional regulator [Mesorhizobium hungaricum]
MTVEDSAPSTQSEADYVRWLDALWAERLLSAREHKPDISIGILLWPTFPMMSLTGVVEPLRHAADFADNSRPLHCRWSIMGKPGVATAASCGIRVQADAPYINPTDFDYIVAIGGLLPHLRTAPASHRDYIRVAAAAGVPVIGVCTGAFVLAQEGLLAGRKAAIHPFHAEDFRLAFPRQALSVRDDFLIENGRITVPGGISILSLMTELIRNHCGPDRAAKAVHQLSLTEQKTLSVFDHERAHSYRYAVDTRIQRAIVLIESRKGRDMSPELAADTVGLSPRQFARLFQKHVGMTPKRFILETRLRYARFLVENSTLPITAIALETGFSDSAHLATAFRQKYQVSPSAFRYRHG